MKSKTKKSVAALLGYILFVSDPVFAFEISTHEALSEKSASLSILNSSRLLAKLGLSDQPLSDISANRFPTSEGNFGSISQLVQFGANWEDGRDEVRQASKHFYNPLNGLGIYTGDDYYYLPPLFNKTFVPPVEIGISSARWAVEAGADRFGSATPPQQFSYRLGRRYFLDALTKSAKADRDKSWGLTFQIVGHVIHHIQDMAQPQHTRNDSHCDKLPCEVTGLLGGVKPSYEKWNGRNNSISDQFGGYDPVYDAVQGGPFKRPEDFWSSGQGASGIGLAQYTNRGFFTAGKNVGTVNFPLPQIEEKNYTTEAISTLCREQQEQGREKCPLGLNGSIRFFKTTVTDSLRPAATAINSRATSRSIFDEDLKRRFLPIEAYSVNRFTYEATNSFVLKRAVGYSAGMINYFFRGDIDLAESRLQPGAYVIQNRGTERLRGTFSLYYDDANEVRYLHKTWNGLTIDVSAEVEVGFIDLPTMPAAKSPGSFMLVFNGDMGEETAATYGIGGVTGAVVSLTPGNALYLVGQDARSQPVFMRVDRFGTRIMERNEFHPLRNLYTFVPNPPILRKSYLAKEAEFFNGGDAYRVRAVTVGKPTAPLVSSGFVFYRDVSNPTSSDYIESFNKLSWRATYQSTGGTRLVKFDLVPQSDRVATLNYVRFDLSTGSPQFLGSGTVPLPAPPVTPDNGFSYLQVAQGLVFVSPDGTRLVGFNDGDNFNTPRVNLELALVVSETISAKWNATLTESNMNVQATVPRTSTQVSTRSTTMPGCPPRVEPMTFDNIPIVRVTESANGDYLTSSTRFFDFQKDKLLGSSTKRRYTTTHELDLISSGFSAGDCFDNWTYQKRSGTSVDYSEEVINYDLLANGGVVGSVFSQERILIGQFDSPSFPNNYSVDYEYEGYLANASTVTFIPLGPTPLPLTGRRLLQAFTGNLNEAITFDLKPVMGQFVYQIDGKIIPSVSGALPAYVADASPIGELFFATSDLNFIIHKPRANGIQVWQKPDSVVGLMAAIWL